MYLHLFYPPPEEGDDRVLDVVELFAVHDGEVEEDEVQRLHVRHVRPRQHLHARVGGLGEGAAEGAREVEEAVAEQHLLRGSPKALLKQIGSSDKILQLFSLDLSLF